MFRAKLKQTKLAGMKEMIENIAYVDDDSNKLLTWPKMMVESVFF